MLLGGSTSGAESFDTVEDACNHRTLDRSCRFTCLEATWKNLRSTPKASTLHQVGDTNLHQYPKTSTLDQVGDTHYEAREYEEAMRWYDKALAEDAGMALAISGKANCR